MNRSKTLEVMASAVSEVVIAQARYGCWNHVEFERRKLEAALTAYESLLHASGMAVVPGWQPIESAPKDGTFVDLLFRGGIRMTDMFWRDDQWWIGDPTDPEYCTGVVRPKATPTHWMPRPTPPASPYGKAKEESK